MTEIRYKRIPRHRVSHDFSEPRMTEQNHRKTCDVRTIMKKYERSGVIEHVNRYGGRYGDFLSASNYHEAMNQVLRAQDMFNSLPSSVRSRFENDPAKFLEFAQNHENAEALAEMGLATLSDVTDNVQKPLDTSNLEQQEMNISEDTGTNGDS